MSSDLENYAKWFSNNGFAFSLDYAHGEWICLAWDSYSDITEDVDVVASEPCSSSEEAILQCFRLAWEANREF